MRLSYLQSKASAQKNAFTFCIFQPKKWEPDVVSFCIIFPFPQQQKKQLREFSRCLPLSFTGFNFPAATIRQNCNKIYEYVFLKDFGTPTFHSYAINVSLLIDDGSPKDGDVTSLTFKAQQFTRYLQPLNRVLKKSAKVMPQRILSTIYKYLH